MWQPTRKGNGHKLPAQLTHFIGRKNELIEIARLLADPNCRLLTLCGPGGIGKTRLAIEAATHNASLFPDGIWMANLEPLSSIDEMISAIVATFGLQIQDGRNLQQQLLNYLSEHNCLLVMDNFEHLLDGAQLVTDMLAAAPNMKILATSRETLKLREEWVRHIQGLDVPDDEQVSDLQSYSAVQLFLEGAHRVRGDFSLDTQISCVVRLCQLVEGLPLAIELASSWLKVMPCAMIIDELQQGLDLLETRLENMPDRHRSIRAVFDQSWRLLSEEEQTVFKKLAVFRGGFSWEAAAFVSEASLFIMSNLVDKAFLRVDGDGRYHLHSLVRQYAEEKLSDSPEDYATTHNQHCHYYCDFLHERYDIWYMYEQSTRDEIEAELDNIRYALDWGIESQAAHQLVMAMSTFCGFCNVESLWQEAHRLFGRVVTSFRQTNHTDVLWRALAFQGWFAQSLGDYEQSTERYTEALAIGRKFGWDSFNIDKGFLDHRLCEQAMRQGNIATAKYHADEVKLINDIPDKPYAMTWVLELKGRVSHLEGDYEQAIVFLQDALSLARTFDSIIATIVILTDLGNVYLNLSDYAMAKQSFEESLLVCKGLYYLHGTTWALIGLGIATHHLGNYHDALSYFCEALETARKTGEALGKLHTLIGIADLWITQGKEADALEFLPYTHQHPAAEWDTRRQAQKILGKLKSKLPNEVFAQATERAKILELDNIVETILAENGNEEEQMSSTITDYPESNLAANKALFEPLTKRELEILHLLASGHTNQEIANQLFIAASTVTKHCSNIFGKLDVRSRTKAIRRARELNLL